jgi:hypothetical protein
MAKAFKGYMKKIHKKDEDAMAAYRGNRYDSASYDDKESQGKSQKPSFK